MPIRIRCLASSISVSSGWWYGNCSVYSSQGARPIGSSCAAVSMASARLFCCPRTQLTKASSEGRASDITTEKEEVSMPSVRTSMRCHSCTQEAQLHMHNWIRTSCGLALLNLAIPCVPFCKKPAGCHVIHVDAYRKLLAQNRY